MSQAVAARPRWSITTRRTGEVFAAGVESDQSQILLLGIPTGFTGPEVEGWLQDLIGVARETSRQDTDERPIPVLLHHTITGLLFSHTELWDRADGSQPCSVAFVETGDAAGFGWVGDANPTVRINGQLVAIQWVRVRDHSGREARAFAVDASHQVEVDLEWSQLPGATDVPGIALHAVWSPRTAPSVEAPHADVTAPAESPEEAYADASVVVENPETPSMPQTLPSVFGMPGLANTGHVSAEPSHETARVFDPVMEPSATPAYPEPVASAESRIHEEEAIGSGEAYVHAETPHEPPRHALTPSPLKPLGWTTVYEDEEPAQRDPLKDERRRGFFSWVAGLMRGRAKPESEVPERMPVVRREDVPEVASSPGEVVFEDVAEPATIEPAAGEGFARLDVDEPMPATAAPVPTTLTPPPYATTPLDEPVFGIPSLEPPPAEIAEPDAHEMVPPSPEPAELTARTVDWRSAPARLQVRPPVPVEPPSEPPLDAEVAPAVPATPRWTRSARSWPSEEEPQKAARPLLQKPWLWGAVIAALFAIGWLVGTMQGGSNPDAGRPNPVTRALRGVGIGGARYDVEMTSTPAGAWIAVDGKDLARRTPATVELKPGEHTVTLTLPDLGSAAYTVRGERGDRVPLEAVLTGSLAIRGSDSGLPIAVSVDGRSLGFVPISLDTVSPGPHEVRFSGPGMASWGSTVIVKVGELTETIAHPMTSPATGVIEVRALAAGSEGSDPLSGATVWVDGERRGSTPFTLELPRGPHSLRVEYQGETAPVQVIDLPGGNQRFATFEFGLDIERGQMTALAPPARIPLDRPTVISASLQGVTVSDVREMWLHLRTPDGTWRRYQMSMLKATGGVVGSAIYPTTMFDESGHARWYVSASTQTGDEYFTELVTSEMAAPPSGRVR